MKLALFCLAAPFLNTLSAAGPPHILVLSPLHAMLHLDWSSLAEVRVLPQKHSPAYSVPAMLKPRDSQNAMHLSFVMVSPLKLDHCGRLRGLSSSTKQPEYDHAELEADGGGVVGDAALEGALDVVAADEPAAGGYLDRLSVIMYFKQGELGYLVYPNHTGD